MELTIAITFYINFPNILYNCQLSLGSFCVSVEPQNAMLRNDICTFLYNGLNKIHKMYTNENISIHCMLFGLILKKQ